MKLNDLKELIAAHTAEVQNQEAMVSLDGATLNDHIISLVFINGKAALTIEPYVAPVAAVEPAKPKFDVDPTKAKEMVGEYVEVEYYQDARTGKLVKAVGTLAYVSGGEVPYLDLDWGLSMPFSLIKKIAKQARPNV